MAKFLALSNCARCAILDDEDYEYLSKHTWRYDGYYVVRTVFVNGSRKKRTTESLHKRVMIDIPLGARVDHINGDTLDNRKSNLRSATVSQNGQNTRYTKSALGLKNISPTKEGKYRVRVWLNGKAINCGVFADLNEAIEAARSARKQYHTHSPENSVLPEKYEASS